MNWDDIELKLLIGMPIDISDGLNMRIPLLKEIINIGESSYNQILSDLLFQKENIENDLPQELKELTTLQLMLILLEQDSRFKQSVINGFKLFFQQEVSPAIIGQEAFFVFENDEKMGESDFNFFQEVIKKANHIKTVKSDEEEYSPANPETQRVIEEMLARRRNKPKPKPKMNLHSIISGLAWKSNDVNIFKIPDLTIYQLYDGFYRQEKIDSYHHTLVGVYSGNVDGKKINFNDIHWTNILKIN